MASCTNATANVLNSVFRRHSFLKQPHVPRGSNPVYLCRPMSVFICDNCVNMYIELRSIFPGGRSLSVDILSVTDHWHMQRVVRLYQIYGGRGILNIWHTWGRKQYRVQRTWMSPLLPGCVLNWRPLRGVAFVMERWVCKLWISELVGMLRLQQWRCSWKLLFQRIVISAFCFAMK